MRAHSVWRGLCLSAAFPAVLFSATHSNILTTPAGVRFGIIGEKPHAPAPTVFFLGKAIEDTLDSTYVQEAFETLGPRILKVSLDTPCHGAERRPGEPTSLSGWRYRLEQGDDIAADLVRRATATLDYLIEQRYTDPTKVAVFGISRGGLMAFHLAAADSRVGPIAGFSPVTDLLTLHELSEMQHDERARVLAAVRLADKLYRHPIWITIGNTDHRVGTERAIEFTQRIIETSEAHGLVPPIELRVLPAKGHSTPDGAYGQAARWLLAQWGQSDSDRR